MQRISLICFSALLFIIPCTNAQIRAQLMAGPKISYTQNTGAAVHSNIGKGGYQGGVYIGYNFPKSNIIIETGLNLSKFDVVIDYGQEIEYFNDPADEPDRLIHFKSFTAFQIPLRAKVNIVPIDSRFIIRPTAGLMLSLKNNHDAFLPDEPFDLEPDSKGFYHIHDGYQERLFFFPLYGSHEVNTILGFEGGLETGYKVTPILEILISATYQNTFKIMNSYVVHIQQEDAAKGNEVYATTATSRLESLNFNLGVAYTFKKK